jgi:putative nucleotidyltransferase with HDIG domain
MPVQLDEGSLTKDIVLAQIPAFPPIVLRLIDLLSHEATETSVLVREISSEASLSAQVLRLANSPLFGLKSQVDTIHHAVVALGFARVQSLVMAVATTDYMKAAMRTEALHKCWQHTLASALLSRELARAAGMDPDRAYTFGLLHDIGRLGLLVAYPDDYESLFQAADRDAVSLLDLEKKRFGLDHCEAGRQLVEQWKLPQEFCVVAGRHHDPPSGGVLDFLTVVHAACKMADTFGYSVVTPLKEASFEEIRSVFPPTARERLADPESLAEILERNIDPDNSLSHVPLVERIAALPTTPTLPAPKEPALFSSLEYQPAAWELPVLLVTALVVLAGLAAACYLSLG